MNNFVMNMKQKNMVFNEIRIISVLVFLATITITL